MEFISLIIDVLSGDTDAAIGMAIGFWIIAMIVGVSFAYEAIRRVRLRK